MEQLGWFASGGGWFCVFAVTVLSYADPDGSALLASASERAQATLRHGKNSLQFAAFG